MLRQHHDELLIRSRGRGLHLITDEVAASLRESRLHEGIVHLLLLHTSASLLIQENADPDVQTDLDRFFTRLVPDGDPLFEHTCEGPDDMSAHVRTALTAVHLGIPFRSGRLVLGTWQGIYLWEHRAHRHARRIALHFLGE